MDTEIYLYFIDLRILQWFDWEENRCCVYDTPCFERYGFKESNLNE